MEKKENKGGFLRNDQVEQDQRVKGDQGQQQHPFHGSQDTGEFMPRTQGTDVQRNDGYTPEDEQDTGRA